MTDDESAWQALISRDARFDGLFYAGVLSTGIYCRPVCPARKPLRANCRFFQYAAQAEQAGFRPCLRCRPELAPGNAPVDQAAILCQQLTDIMEASLADKDFRLSHLAERVGLSERQLRRITQQQLGTTPIELWKSLRLKIARQLLCETTLPVTTIAFTSGFGSLRQFNAVFAERYPLSPRAYRNDHRLGEAVHDHQSLTLQVAYRPPFDWPTLLGFLEKRRISEVESINDDHYLRTLAVDGHQGWIRVGCRPQRHCLMVEVSNSLVTVLPAVLQKVRQLFDTGANPEVINAYLGSDPLLGPVLAEYPGIRVPGCCDPFELALRAILGQQVTVAAATTLSGRLAHRFGKPITTPFTELCRLPPTAEDFREACEEDFQGLGIVRQRITAILALATAEREGFFKRLQFQTAELQFTALTALPGIGPWTARYIAMRAFNQTDAFPKEDIALRNALGGLSPRQCEAYSQRWSPWRSYAVMLLWQKMAQQV
ncbi:AlkA N-terminal domain-containing protein [Tatumella saanichensis]|uniref:AlkA N-terminal domain-containing protein n=1 Tax=Tatumella saanichensis TaxID=480813 RepID=UPI0004A3D3BF|nr:AlkA N-terminal domain-containing protein [Tatumella saanichensis]